MSIKMSMDVSPELNNALDDMAKQTHSTKSDVLLKSIVLMKVAIQEKMNGNHISIVGKDHKIIKEIIGF